MSEVQIKAEGDASIFGDVVGRDKITINLPPPLPPAEAKDRANLLILLRKVKTFWIEGVLEKSVHNAVLLELGKETRPEAVEHPWGMVLELPDQTNQVLPPGTKIIDIFEKMNRSILILGEPGSGKTITLLELARDLIICAEADPTQPIPVVFNLSSWLDKRQSLRDWLLLELSSKYQIPKRIGRTWLKENRILPFLDGLDEIKSENRAACIEAINHFGEAFGLPGRVVCSRHQEYSKLPARLKLNGAVYLQPLTFRQVDNYLEAGGSKLAGLRSTFEKDQSLQELVQTPLMLNIMCLAYQDSPVEGMTRQAFVGIEDHCRHLFDAYIASMLKRKGKAPQPYSIEQTIDWLKWVARNMWRHNHTLFLLEQLQPSWLSDSTQRFVYLLSSRVIAMTSFLGISLLVKSEAIDLLHAIGIALIGGTIVSSTSVLIDWVRFEKSVRKPKKATSKWMAVFYILFHLLVWGVLGWLGMEFLDDSVDVLVIALLAGLFGGLFFGLRNGRRSIYDDIMTIEKIPWSWTSARMWHALGPPAIVLAGLWGGFTNSISKQKILPNQGIKLSIRNSILGGLLFSLFGGWFGLLEMIRIPTEAFTYSGMVVNWFLGSLFFGGMDVIQHYTIRFILLRKRYAPLNYARFLDHCVNLVFLQKVGGGYIFIHRLLLEHFAAMPLQNETQKKTIQ